MLTRRPTMTSPDRKRGRLRGHSISPAPSSRARGLGALGSLLAALAICAAIAAPAQAISDSEELGSFGSEGSAAGQLRSAVTGIATDPMTGHVLVNDLLNARVDEFTPWGEFVKAFGWDVAPGAVNEQQEVRIRATAGQFKLGFGAEITGDLPFDATAEEVEDALEGLASIGPGGVRVEQRKGDAGGTTPYIDIIVFSGASLAGSDVETVDASDGTTPLSGGVPATSLLVRTRADGGPPAAGLESCTEESGCRQGQAGSGTGQIYGGALAVDTGGDIYVGEGQNYRVQEFDPAGRFVSMFGGEVNKTRSEEAGTSDAERNLCTREEVELDGDECQKGTEGTGHGQFTKTFAIAVGPADQVFVSSRLGDEPTDEERENGPSYLNVEGRIQTFAPGGAYESEFTTEGTPTDVAWDPQTGSLYVDYTNFGRSSRTERGTLEDVYKLSAAGVPEGTIPVSYPTGLAVDPNGNLHVVDHKIGDAGAANQVERILEFGPSGSPLSPPSCCTPKVLPGETEESEDPQRYSIGALGANAVGDLYVFNAASAKGSFVRFYGPPPTSFESPLPVPPTIAGQFSTAVGPRGGTLTARINPHFWTDATYYVEYGTKPCSEGGCEAAPAPPGQLLTSKVTAEAVPTNGIVLEGLEPGTTYYYRFVTQSGGGGPVFGPDRHFVTFQEEAGSEICPANLAFRVGSSAGLPDCRAYEMVSPVDKEGGDIGGLLSGFSYSTALYQSAVSGEKISYSSYRPFAGSESGSLINQYLATREAGGWSSQPLLKAHGPTLYAVGFAIDNQFKGFTPDLCDAWVLDEAASPLAPGAVEGFPNLYTRHNCGADAGTYTALTTVTPTEIERGDSPENYFPEPQGSSTDGSKALVRVGAKLTPDAAGKVSQLYLVSGGQPHLVCILPNGEPSGGACSAGSGPVSVGDINRVSLLTGAISSDGSRVYWTAKTTAAIGQIYLRSNPERPQSALIGGKCSEPENACTVAVSQASAAARFWAASPDGAKALYAIEDSASPLDENLYFYDAGTGARQKLAEGVKGVVAGSEDLSSVYFVSDRVISGTTGAVNGEPNLYLYADGNYKFIATLAALDVVSSQKTQATVPSDIEPKPVWHAAQATADGSALAFVSTASLAGYDNTDAASGKADSEVYVYDAEADRLECAACNPTGANPLGREFHLGVGGILPTAASLPLPLGQFHTPRALSEGGGRLFFNSYDALTRADTNGKQDAYEWERPGIGGCLDTSPAYSAANGGCIYLISTGKSVRDSEFVDAGADGRDAFFTTGESLLPQDPGLVDLYVARSGGGFPLQAGPPEPCRGEACQPTQAGPSSPPIGSSAPGPGNSTPSRPCSKGKHLVERKGKKKCVKNHGKRKKHHRSHGHRAAGGSR